MKIIKVLMSAMLIIAMMVSMVGCDLFVDNDAEFHSGKGELMWRGVRYVEIVGVDVSGTTKVLSRMSLSDAVHEIAEDPSQTFLMVRHGGNTHYVVREDYVVPTEGDVTAFLWDGRYITDETVCKAIEEMLGMVGTMPTFYHETDNLYALEGDAQTLERVYLAYEGCPVTTDFVGFVGKVDGKLVYAEKPQKSVHTYQNDPPITVKCHEIPEPLATIIASCLQFE